MFIIEVERGVAALELISGARSDRRCKGEDKE
jgi:hypothetical protein